MDKDALYTRWLEYIFDRPDSGERWYFSPENEDETFNPNNADVIYLLDRMFLHCGTDLKHYSNNQLDNGFRYIFDNGASDTIFSFFDKTIPKNQRIAAAEKMRYLYSECFAQRCSPILGHLSEDDGNPLNHICYMLWDISPFLGWENTVLEVMEAALYTENPACVESGLHGLGHRKTDRNEVNDIIDRFLKKGKILRPELRHYAEVAKTGYIQ